MSEKEQEVVEEEEVEVEVKQQGLPGAQSEEVRRSSDWQLPPTHGGVGANDYGNEPAPAYPQIKEPTDCSPTMLQRCRDSCFTPPHTHPPTSTHTSAVPPLTGLSLPLCLGWPRSGMHHRPPSASFTLHLTADLAAMQVSKGRSEGVNSLAQSRFG